MLKTPGYAKIISLIAITAAVLRIAAVFVINDYEYPNTWEYGAIAENIRAGKGYVFNWYEDEEPLPTSLQ